MMATIAKRTESALPRIRPAGYFGQVKSTITDMISQSVAKTAVELDGTAILAPTESGFTARMISKYRTNVPIIAVTPHQSVMRKLRLVWGVVPLHGGVQNSTDEMLEMAVNTALDSGLVKRGDLIVITAGVPLREPGTTNLMKIHVIGDIIAKGQGIGEGIVTGKAVVGEDADEINAKMKEGYILVTTSTDKEMMDSIAKAKAIVTAEGGLTSHAAIVGLNLGIPVIVGVGNVFEKIKDGMEITVDSKHGHIYVGQAKVL